MWPADRHVRMRWANGGGLTTEIIAEPSSTMWEWRLSVADVDAAGPFSVFPDVDRTIALLRGHGFTLSIAGDTEDVVISEPFQPFEFSGDEVTSCRLIDGAVQDLNLMTRRDSTDRRLEFIHLAPHASTEIGGMDIVVVVAGGIRIGDRDLGYLDAIRPVGAAGALNVISSGEGAVLAAVTVRNHR